jgi:hypothetical protein
MKHSLRSVFVASIVLPTLTACAQHSPYVGQEQRSVKSLSLQDMKALREGRGMGLAKAAELNGYPGPMHVLELRNALELSTQQAQATQQLMAQHKARARELGVQVIEAERALDALFAQSRATPEQVSQYTQRIAQLQAQLRAEHLNTHLAQTALLNDAQIRRYSELRGYSAAMSNSLQPKQH